MEQQYKDALNLVTNVFRYKKDKGGAPYINHLKYVSERSIYYGEIIFSKNGEVMNEEVKLALKTVGLLHDLIEDFPIWTPTHLFDLFSSSILYNVQVLTKGKDENYMRYIETIPQYKIAMAVKLADLEHNMNVSRLSSLTDKDIERLKKYHVAYQFLINKIK